MSKAFTRESDEAPETPPPRRHASPLPPGAKNYLTEDGAKKFSDELQRMLHTLQNSRDPSSGNSLPKEELQVLEERIAAIQAILNSAEVVPTPASPQTVRFGVSVTVRHQDGRMSTYRIVGVDEVDLDRDWISWISPLARALVGAGPGDRVRAQFPGGYDQLEILHLRTPDLQDSSTPSQQE